MASRGAITTTATGAGGSTSRPRPRSVLLSGVPYDLRGSFVSLLAWEGQNMLEARSPGGPLGGIRERHYAGIFEDYDPANRTSAEAAIRAAHNRGCAECARG